MDIRSLSLAVARIHGGDNDWLGSEAVRLQAGGRTSWQGDVGVFALHGHPQAERCYAFQVTLPDGEPVIHAVLLAPPVDSAAAAVNSIVGRPLT